MNLAAENPLLSEAVNAALSMHPDRPGVGRLCQELLSAVTNRPVTVRVKASVFFTPSAAPVGKPGLNPWGRKGRPEIAA